MSGIKGSLKRGASWIAATRIMVNAISFLSTIILARLLSPADFGLVAIATSVLAVAMALTELSLSSALLRHETLDDSHFHSAWSVGLVRAALVALLFCALAYPMAWSYHDHRLVAVLIVTGLTGGITGLLNPKLAVLTKRLVFWQDFAVQVSQKALSFLVAVPLALIYRSYWSLVLGNCAATIVSVLLSYAIIPYIPRWSLSRVKDLLGFSIWLSLGEAVNTLNWKFDQLVIGYLFNASRLGSYVVADTLSSLPTREATLPIAQTLFPGFTAIAGDAPRLREAYQLAQTTLCALALPIGFGFAVVAHPVVVLALGEKWLSAVTIIRVLSGVFALQTLSSSLQPLAMAKNETRVLFGRDLRTFFVRIPFIVVGVAFFGFIGLIWARAVSSIIMTVMNMQLVARLIGVSVVAQFLANWRSLVGTLVMIGACGTTWLWIVAPLAIRPVAEVALQVCVGALAYGGTLAMLWIASGRPKGPEAEVARLLPALLPR